MTSSVIQSNSMCPRKNHFIYGVGCIFSTIASLWYSSLHHGYLTTLILWNNLCIYPNNKPKSNIVIFLKDTMYNLYMYPSLERNLQSAKVKGYCFWTEIPIHIFVLVVLSKRKNYFKFSLNSNLPGKQTWKNYLKTHLVKGQKIRYVELLYVIVSLNF